MSGKLYNPQSRWGGIARTLTTNDFEAANIEFIQFWMMDPFNEDANNTTGGDFYINLGNVSEDLQEMEENRLKMDYPQTEILR